MAQREGEKTVRIRVSETRSRRYSSTTSPKETDYQYFFGRMDRFHLPTDCG